MKFPVAGGGRVSESSEGGKATTAGTRAAAGLSGVDGNWSAGDGISGVAGRKRLSGAGDDDG